MSQSDIPGNRLLDRVGRVYILAYQETTHILEETLIQEGFACEVLRQTDQPAYRDYAAIYRCMLNHEQAWQKAAQEDQPTLILEADFVPVVGMGQLPIPFDVLQADVGIAWLYTCAPQLYSVTPEGYGEGYSTSLVAYLVTPQAAAALGGFVAEITAKHGTGYYTFDSDMDSFLRAHGFKNYIPFRNYGEHGGRSNPEHRRNGMSGIHRADVLYDKLAFMPPYTTGTSYSAFLWARIYARLKGIARLLMGRFLRPYVAGTSSVPWRLITFAIRRQFSLRLY